MLIPQAEELAKTLGQMKQLLQGTQGISRHSTNFQSIHLRDFNC